jgi:flagellar hook-associated protein 2
LNTSGTGGTDTLQAAQNAIIVLGDPTQNPVTLQRSSNSVSDAVSGVTLTLKQTSGSGTVNVGISRDTGAVKDNIKNLLTAYNDAVKFINERSTYDVTTKKGGLFFGESSSRSAISQLRQALSADVAGLSTYTAVGQLGFRTERDGTVTVTDAILDAALSTNYAAVKALFINQVPM